MLFSLKQKVDYHHFTSRHHGICTVKVKGAKRALQVKILFRVLVSTKSCFSHHLGFSEINLRQIRQILHAIKLSCVSALLSTYFS